MHDVKARIFSSMQWMHNDNVLRAIRVSVEGSNKPLGLTLTTGSWNSVATSALMSGTVQGETLLSEVVLSSDYSAYPTAYKSWRVKYLETVGDHGPLVGWFKIAEPGYFVTDSVAGDIATSPLNGPTCVADGIVLDGVDDYIDMKDWEFGGTTSIEAYVWHGIELGASEVEVLDQNKDPYRCPPGQYNPSFGGNAGSCVMCEVGKYNSGVLTSTFNSFGIVSGVEGGKSASYEAYSGSSPSGPNEIQYTKSTMGGSSTRSGGYQYTDLVLEGDFTVTFKSEAGSDAYNLIGFHEASYTEFTHSTLTGSGGYATAAQWAAYGRPGNQYDVSFDGVGGTENSISLVPGYSTGLSYISYRREGDTLKLYDSITPPGDNDVASVMTLRHIFSDKYEDPVRLGFFIHDVSDSLEVYSPGTSITLLGYGDVEESSVNSCDICKVGTYADAEGSTSCSSCSNNQTSFGGVCVPAYHSWDFRGCTTGASVADSKEGFLNAVPVNGATCSADGIRLDAWPGTSPAS
ncbi:hypothetical protein TrLO_g15740 [Triparma laevis f. longispina]|uniref:Tyrosine-protein kinase ephrin type A/B receptor-like domain-containing protein n=1 Tax=Triparma laevis f. longispina TaxID=1714387 RepID=A0A9W7F6B5_9STRA|nr:hypothetical protein TrLO_g15740 [Triparma laevis f. longispina]